MIERRILDFLISFITPVANALNSKIINRTKQLYYTVSESDFVNGTLSKEKRKYLLEIDGEFNLKRFPRYSTETDDSPRINRCIKASNGGKVFIPDGKYIVKTPIIVNNRASIKMSNKCLITAVEEMDYIFKLNGDITTNADISHDEDDNYIESLSPIFEGGMLDGNCKASCINVKGYRHLIIRDCQLNNGKIYGLFLESANDSYEVIVNKLYGKVNKRGLSGNTFIKADQNDCHISDCISVDYDIGISTGGGSNRLDKCHVWNGPITRDFSNTISFYIKGGNTILANCYADSSAIGYDVETSCQLIGCSYFNNYVTFGIDNVECIKNTNKKQLLVVGGFWTKKEPNGVFYSGDETNNVKFISPVLNGYELPLWASSQ